MIQKSPKFLIATHNPGKISYFKHAFANTAFNPISLSDCGISTIAQETGTTLLENATIKATTYGKLSGMVTLSDDSGLFIDALDGLPGVNSAEYGGKDLTDDQRIAYLLKKLEQVPVHQRTAHFISVIALYFPNGECHTYTGRLDGIIIDTPKGQKIPKLPYRQVFYIPQVGKTLDELGLHSGYEKHRSQALEQAVSALHTYFNLLEN